MELFKILGIVAINSDEANRQLDEVSGNAEKASGKIGSALGKVAGFVGKATIAAVGAAATGLTVLTKNALSAAGELEQNMGGAEAVFGMFSDGMVKKAEEAYKKMGLSQSDYLATANKMGALFQGSGFTIQDSAKMSSEAMQRAADVASIMGIDVSSAMEAVAGAAKGNFTMMDNLGVAINDTTLEIYAQEKGLGKLETTQDKVAAAMQMFMEKTEYAAGNYAKENETLSGSLTTLKAAWSNWLSGAGDTDQLADSVVNATDVIIKNLEQIIPRITEGISGIFSKLAPQLPEKIQKILPSLLEGCTKLIEGVANMLPEILAIMLPVIIEQVPVIISALFNAIVENKDKLLEAGMQIMDMIAEGLGMNTSSLLSVISGLLGGVGAFKILTFLGKIPSLIGKVKVAVSALFTLISANPIGTIITVLAAIIGYLITLYNTNDEFRAKVDETVNAIVSWIQQAVSNVVAWVSQAVSDISTFITETIPNTISAVIEWFASLPGRIAEWAVNMYTTAVEFLRQFAQGILDGFLELVGKVGDWVQENLITPIENKVAEFINVGAKVVENIRTGISNAWGSLVSWFEGIWSSLFSGRSVDVSVYGSGGGYASGLDYVPYNNFPAMLHEGEAVLTASEADAWRKGSGGAGNGVTIIQNISAPAQTPVQLASATAAYFEQARWAL